MALIDYAAYTALGYDLVPEAVFPRYEVFAENYVTRMIQNRAFILPDDVPGVYNNKDPVRWSEQNRRGICEITDIYFKFDKAMSGVESGQVVTGFSNQHYSESYASPEDTQKFFGSAMDGILLTYFTGEQLYRGVD